jgi:predicted Zn-dependent peptidase
VRAEALGGALVPTVSEGAVGWSLTVPSAALPRAAELLRLVCDEGTYAPDEVATERSLQASDAARARDDMFAYPLRRVLEVTYPGSAHGLPTLGEPETVETFDVEAVRDWAARLRARRLTVIAVGDLGTEQLLDGVRCFEGWSGDAVERHDVASDWEVASDREHRDKAQSAMAMAFPAEPYGHQDRFATVVIAAMLSGLAGRLFKALRDERSLAYTVAAIPWLKRVNGAVITYIANSPEREAEAREAMLAELARLPVDAIELEELERARNYTAGALQLRLQSAHSVASELLTEWVHGDLSRLHEAADRLRAVSEEDVRRVAASVLDAARRSEFVLEGTGGGR